MSKARVIVVLGATGAGKSKLALELAERFGGEIISADAMQMYKGLDIVTNKVTKDELAQVRHHVIDFIDPMERCTVVDFKNKALPIVQDLLSRNVMPVICGGTNYYIESLLWDVLVDQSASAERPIRREEEKEITFGDDISNSELYEKLKAVDPERAGELHPNDRRKVIRSLQVFQKTGQPHSLHLSEQQSQSGGNHLGGPLRFPDCLVLWVQCQQHILDERCNKRVDKMIQRGMVKELEDFHKDYNSKRTEPADYTVGIFQSIGFKEFHDYLLLDSDAEKRSERGQALFQMGVEQLKLVTRKYARKQLKWMRNRFLDPDRHCPPIYAVDSSQPERWATDCYGPAVRIVEAALAGRDPKDDGHEPLPLRERRTVDDKKDLRRTMFHCDLCQRYLQGAEQYEIHLASKAHRMLVRKQAAAAVENHTVLVRGFDPECKTDTWRKLKDLSGLPLSTVKAELELEECRFDLKLCLDREAADKVASELRNEHGAEAEVVRVPEVGEEAAQDIKKGRRC